MHKSLYSHNVTVLYMFRAVLCSSSGGQIVCIKHTVSSLYEWPWWSCSTLIERDHDHSYRVTIPYAVNIQFDLLMMNIIPLETCRGL